MRFAIIATSLSLVAAVPTAAAQLLPIKPGDHIRVAPADSAELGLWTAGTALDVTRTSLLYQPEGTAEPVRVALGRDVRVHVGSASPVRAVLWGAVGATVGTVLGATILSKAFDGEQLGTGWKQEAVGFGTIGVLAGIVAGMAVGPRRWEDVPLTDAGIPAAPLTRAPNPPARFGERSNWRVFPATESQFMAFFQVHRDSLLPMEGIWQILSG
ncbi:MAG TPA: hypothetical protein VD793_02880, partial [Gemmatimonadales bacterium]|nr:hypothetical protein [Gemmatimonadales bacterium]